MATAEHAPIRRLSGPGGLRSVAARARARRWSEFVRHFPDLSEMNVLDLGGIPAFWSNYDVRPARVTTVNLDEFAVEQPWITHEVADACSYAGTGFDLVVSNSLLEHVGGPEPRRRLAEVVHRAAPRHWVQTPYRYFPIEPHWMFPGFQWLPLSAKVAVAQRWKRGYMQKEGYEANRDECLFVELLTKTEMRALFPSSELWQERLAGMTKSIVAIRS